jgi:hypothetical protein
MTRHIGTDVSGAIQRESIIPYDGIGPKVPMTPIPGPYCGIEGLITPVLCVQSVFDIVKEEG